MFDEKILSFQEERERALKAKQEEEMIERHVIEIRKEMQEKRLQDEEHRKQFDDLFFEIEKNCRSFDFSFCLVYVNTIWRNLNERKLNKNVHEKKKNYND